MTFNKFQFAHQHVTPMDEVTMIPFHICPADVEKQTFTNLHR